MDEVIEVQPTSCTEACDYQATLSEPVDSKREEELMQQVERWYQEAKSLDQKLRESTMKVVQLRNLLQETRCSLRSKLDESNEKIVALSIENLFFKRQNSTAKCEELRREQESLMSQLSSRPDYHKINELKETVQRLTAEKITLQEQYEDLNARFDLQAVHSNRTNQTKLNAKLTDMKLENAKLNKQNEELILELQEITEKSVHLKQQNEQLTVELQVTVEKKMEGDEYETEARFIKRAQSLNLTSPADVKTLDGCTDCISKIVELDSLKIRLNESEKDLEQTKHEIMKMTAQIGFLQGELGHHKKLAEESSVKASGSRVDNCAASAKILASQYFVEIVIRLLCWHLVIFVTELLFQVVITGIKNQSYCSTQQQL